MTNDVFNSDPVVDPVAELVGEGKKFGDVAALAKGKLEADQFIERLKTEMAELRGQLEGQTRLDELKEELKQLKEQNQLQPKSQTGNALSETDIKALVTKAITDIEVSRTANQNIQEATSALVQKLGSHEKANEFVISKAKELGISTETLKGVAEKSPTAFLKMVDTVQAPAQGETFVRGTVNTQGQGPASGAKEGTWEYFSAIKDKNPREYWSAKTQNAIFKAVQNGTMVLPG